MGKQRELGVGQAGKASRGPMTLIPSTEVLSENADIPSPTITAALAGLILLSLLAIAAD